MRVYTIGFTKRTAADFFDTLKTARIELLLDVRLNNVSQLAGFSKRDDLRYFLKQICQCDYQHETLLAPTQLLLDEYKKAGGGWEKYSRAFLRLMAERQIENKLERGVFEKKRTVLLCSEHDARHCHRTLVLEYLNDCWGNVEIVNL